MWKSHMDDCCHSRLNTIWALMVFVIGLVVICLVWGDGYLLCYNVGLFTGCLILRFVIPKIF